MKLLFVTDTHLRGTTPRSRTDSLPDTQVTKLREVAGLAQEYGVKAILHGGDMFDLPSPALSVAAATKILSASGADIYAVAGNHDLFAYNPATLDRTMLGFLARMGLIKLLHPGERVYLRDGNVTVQLSGQHFHHQIDRRDPALDYAVAKENCDLAIHMVHGMMTNSPIFPGAAHTPIKTVAQLTRADYTLCGHAHFGFPDTEIDGHHFINPGAMVRLSAHPVEIKRSPGVLLLDFSATGPVHKHIPLKTARPGEQVLDRTHLEETAYRKERLAQLLKEIRAEGDYQQSDLNDIILDIAHRQGLSEQVRREALARLARVRESLEQE